MKHAKPMTEEESMMVMRGLEVAQTTSIATNIVVLMQIAKELNFEDPEHYTDEDYVRDLHRYKERLEKL